MTLLATNQAVGSSKRGERSEPTDAQRTKSASARLTGDERSEESSEAGVAGRQKPKARQRSCRSIYPSAPPHGGNSEPHVNYC